MSKCIDCGCNFVTAPESSAPKGQRCGYCERERLRDENATLRTQLAQKQQLLTEAEIALIDMRKAYDQLRQEQDELRGIVQVVADLDVWSPEGYHQLKKAIPKAKAALNPTTKDQP